MASNVQSGHLLCCIALELSFTAKFTAKNAPTANYCVGKNGHPEEFTGGRLKSVDMLFKDLSAHSGVPTYGADIPAVPYAVQDDDIAFDGVGMLP